jgi:PAS domain-containing protein
VKEILNLIREPVFVVDSNGIIKTANDSGRKVLGKSYDEIENVLGGDAFECIYAGLDGGCGRTEHCKTCAIRNTLKDTLNTGREYKNVPAFQNIKTDSGPEVLKFLISTEKVEEQVLLRIDEVSGNPS